MVISKKDLENYLQNIEKYLLERIKSSSYNGVNIDLENKCICNWTSNLSLHIDYEKIYIHDPTAPEYILLSFYNDIPSNAICRSYYRNIKYDEALDFIIAWDEWLKYFIDNQLFGDNTKENRVATILKKGFRL